MDVRRKERDGLWVHTQASSTLDVTPAKIYDIRQIIPVTLTFLVCTVGIIHPVLGTEDSMRLSQFLVDSKLILIGSVTLGEAEVCGSGGLGGRLFKVGLE